MVEITNRHLRAIPLPGLQRLSLISSHSWTYSKLTGTEVQSTYLLEKNNIAAFGKVAQLAATIRRNLSEDSYSRVRH